MKEKTSITLSADVLARVDRAAGRQKSRSAFIEEVLSKFFHEQGRRAIAARDLAILNSAAERLNPEAEDVLEYQSGTFEP